MGMLTYWTGTGISYVIFLRSGNCSLSTQLLLIVNVNEVVPMGFIAKFQELKNQRGN